MNIKNSSINREASESMDSRSLLTGLVLIVAGCGGSALISIALFLPASGFFGLLLVILPVFVLLWGMDIRIRNLEEITLSGNRQVRRAVEIHATRMAHRYDTTIEQMNNQHEELCKRVYR